MKWGGSGVKSVDPKLKGELPDRCLVFLQKKGVFVYVSESVWGWGGWSEKIGRFEYPYPSLSSREPQNVFLALS